MIDLSSVSLPVIFAVSLLGMVICLEVGLFFGQRARRLGGDSISTLEAAVLGLLALMIGFSVSISVTRFDSRRDAILDEANAIGTAALRGTLLHAPHDATNLRLLRAYTDLRLTLTAAIDSPAEMTRIIDSSNALLAELWADAKTLAAIHPAVVPTGLYLESLNALIDMQEKRLSALRSRVPNIVLIALYGIAFVAIGFVGYGLGLEPKRRRSPAYMMGLLVAAVLLLILDMDRPSTGFIHVSQRPLIDAAASLRSLGN
ncbi:MAG: hypothetical protein ACOVQ8_03650 [Elstera sp.]